MALESDVAVGVCLCGDIPPCLCVWGGLGEGRGNAREFWLSSGGGGVLMGKQGVVVVSVKKQC